MAGKDSLAHWASMFALRHHKPCLQDQEARLVSLRRKEMPQGFLCDHWYGHERSHIALNKWLIGFYLMSSSGVSAHQLHRALKLGYKTAWFMCHRIREAMRSDSNSWSSPVGRSGKVVEADETYFARTDEPRRPKKLRAVPYTTSGKFGPADKRATVALVEHGANVRTFRVRTADKIKVGGIVKKNIACKLRLHTDKSCMKRSIGEYVSVDMRTRLG